MPDKRNYEQMSVFCTVGNTPGRRFTASSVTVGYEGGREVQSPIIRCWKPGLESSLEYELWDWRSVKTLTIVMEGLSSEGLDSSLKVRLSYNDAVALAHQLVALTQQVGVDMCNVAAKDLADLRNTLNP